MDDNQTLLYVSYGKGPHVEQLKYSIITATRPTFDTSSFAAVVCTDDPRPFAELDVETRLIDGAVLQQWLGDTTYHWRRKLEAIRAVLVERPGKLVYADGDTWWRQSPAVAFDRIAPGRSCMHIKEGGLLETGTAVNAALSHLVDGRVMTDAAGEPFEASPRSQLWNAGVIGIHSDDERLVHNALHMTDQMWHADPTIETIEQFAVSYWLQRNELHALDDVVFHYWPTHLREPFAAVLPVLLRDLRRDNLEGRMPELLAHRPVASRRSQSKMAIRRTMRRCGLPARGIMASG